MSSQATDVKNGVEVSNYDVFSNVWILFGIAGSVGIVVLLVILFLKWSNSDTTKEFDQRIAEMLAGSLANKMNISESDIVDLLAGRSRAELIPKLKNLIDSVNVNATKTNIGQPVEISVNLKYKDGTSYSARSSIVWDDLPSKIREDLIRTQVNTVKCSWSLPS
jgi:hypothetical protein